MNARERFLEVMDFNPNVRTMKWEFGYWGQTVMNWYEQGLPKNHFPSAERPLTTPTASLYTPAWTSLGKGKLSPGIAVMAGGLYYPTQGFPLDEDVRSHFKMDQCQRVVDVNLLFHPMFDVEVLDDNEEYFDYIDVDGVTRRFGKEEGTIPTSMKWPIYDEDSWYKLKEERLNLDDIKGRFPAHWKQLVEEYKNRDYPLALGGYPAGFFGTVSHLIGYENVFVWYYEEPELMHDILDTLTSVWMAVYEEVLAEVEIDHLQIWEDISFGKGSMISPPTVEEFMCPYIKRMTDFLKSKGVKHALLDTDGDCYELISIFENAGVTGMYPFEVHCGMDVERVRREHPNLQILGGVPKSEITKGTAKIDEILQPIERVLKTGGYVPFGDHFIPPDVPFEEFSYYRNKLNDMIDACGE